MIIALILLSCLAGVVVCIKRAMPYDPNWDELQEEDGEPAWNDDDKRYSGLLEEEE